MTLTSWSHAWSKIRNISTRCSSMKWSGSGVHVFQLAFEHTEGILNTYFSYVWYLYRRTLRQSYVCAAVACSGRFCFGLDLTKPSITNASVDRFYLNLVICLQLRHCWSRILLKSDIVCWSYDSVYRGLLFSWTQCMSRRWGMLTQDVSGLLTFCASDVLILWCETAEDLFIFRLPNFFIVHCEW